MKLIKVQFSRKQLTVFLFLIVLSVIGTSAYLIQEGFWANINSQGMIRLAKENWDSGEYSISIYWYRSAYSTAFMGGLRWNISKLFSDQIDSFVQQGKIYDAQRVCKLAKMIWDQEGAVSYKCQQLDKLAP